MTSTDAESVATLWITDAELIRRIGVPDKIARATLRELDRNPHSGFPQKQKLWGDRRYWPAVKAYFDATMGGAARVAPEPRTPYPAAAFPLRTPLRRGHA